MGTLYLIRHGEVDWNRENAYVGSTDIPLNAKGEDQARQLAEHLSSRRISAVYTSDLSRARRTGEIIAQDLDLTANIVPALREVDYGAWEGVPEAEVHANDPVYPEWAGNPVEVRIPGGETFGELRDRACPAFMEIAEANIEGNVVVVAHKSVNRVILAHLLGMDVNCYRQIGQGNTCINRIERRPDGRYVVESINEQGHLG